MLLAHLAPPPQLDRSLSKLLVVFLLGRSADFTLAGTEWAKPLAWAEHK
ncbi:uncharacterized protein METZ01_LOCUS360775, partial [marine metagenome]